jgi:YidC/Oxa1 family membrane protein insertase
MNKDILKATIASILVILIWDHFGLLRPQPQNRPVPPPPAASGPAPAKTHSPLPAETPLPAKEPAETVQARPAPRIVPDDFPRETRSLETGTARYEITNIGGGIVSAKFGRFDREFDYEQSDFRPLSLLRVGPHGDLSRLPFVFVPTDAPDSVALVSRKIDGLELRMDIQTAGKDYLLEMRLRVQNRGDAEHYLNGGVEVVAGNLVKEKGRTYSPLSFTRYTIENKLENVRQKKLDAPRSLEEPYYWAGVQNNTFCGLVKEKELLNGVHWYPLEGPDRDAPRAAAGVSTGEFVLAPGESRTFSFHCYFGPKLYFHMKDLNLTFENVIDYGAILGSLTRLLVKFLNFLYNLTGNYGFAIIIMTLCVRMLTFPLMRKSMLSMKAMQKLQPQIKEIQARHKDDQMQMQREMMALYKKHNLNPMSGCFPVLIQLPIFFAFFRAIANSVELQGASFFFIRNLAEPDALLPLGAIRINVLPPLLGLLQVLSSRQTTTDPSQKHLMIIFPILMIVLFYKMPAALNLYFLVSTLVGILQNWLIKLPPRTKEAGS